MTTENSEDVVEAVRNEDYETLEVLLMKEKPTTATLTIAVETGNLVLLRFLCEYCNLSEYDNASWLLNKAVLEGHMNIVQYLHDQIGLRSDLAVIYAATKGRYEFVQWFTDHSPYKHDMTAMNMAANSGHLKIVQYLHTKFIEKAIEYAEKGKQKEIVDWLTSKVDK